MCLHAPTPVASRATGVSLESERAKRHCSVTIVSQNVRGLKSVERLEELFTALKRRNIFAACIQETWRTGTSTLEHGKSRLILAGLDPTAVRGNRGSQGVGIALSDSAVDSWKAAGSEIHTDLGARVAAIRLLTKDVRGKDVGIFLVSAYAPVGVAEQEVWDEFFDALDICLKRKKKDDVLLIGTDSNSSMGVVRQGGDHKTCLAALGKFGLEHVNESGRRFASYLAISNLTTLTTCFQKKSYATWIHPRSKKPHQIDHIITSRSEFCRFTDAGSTEPLIDSDHRAVNCKLRVMHRLKKRSSPRQRLLHLNYNVLSDKTTSANFCNEVYEKYCTLPEDTPRYSRLAESTQHASLHLLPKQPKPQPGWFQASEDKLLPLIEERNRAMELVFTRRLRSNTMRLKNARKLLKSAVSKAKNDWILSQCHTMNDISTRGTKEHWDTLGRLRNGLSKAHASAEVSMKKPDGSRCKSAEENAEVFRAHFQTLYGRTPTYDATVLEMLTQHPVVVNCDHVPSDDEIRSATNRLKNKGPGLSGICPQAWKALLENDNAFQILRLVILEFWVSEMPPEEWQTGLLKILAKKGDLSLPGNYRGIMLLETAYKIIAILLHDRLQPIEEGLNHENQCGFRPKRGCADAVFTVKLAMKKRREHGQETWILFLDLVKAFDRVPRELLWEVLRKFGVPDKLIQLLKSLHAHVDVKFVVNEVTHTIQCIIGVKQGDILGPILFLFYLAAVMQTWRDSCDRSLCVFRTKMDDCLTGRSYRARGEEFDLSDSEYADDTAVLFTSRESLVEGTPHMIAHFSRWGLEIHVGRKDKESKSEVLFVAAPPHTYEDPITYDGKDLSSIDLGGGVFIPVVAVFCYLGSMLSRDCKDDADVTARITAAGNAFGALRASLFTSVSICFSAKRLVYNGLILPILLYGADSWCLTEKLFNKLRLFHARCVRAICRVNRLHTREHRITTVELLQRVGLRSMDSSVTKCQLRWAGHVARMDHERIPRKMLTSWVHSKRPRGCPEFTYGRGVVKALKKVHVDKRQWISLAQNRDEWRKTINTLQ